jgi:hypothetical protein
VPKEDTHLKCTLPDGSRVFGSRVPGEDGTICFLANGQVAVAVGGPAFFKQGRKVISRFKANPDLFEELEAIFQPPFDSSGSELLHSLVGIANQTQFERRLDALVSTLRAIHELRIGRFGTPRSRQFIDAIGVLASKHQRPPTKLELKDYFWAQQDYRLAERSVISLLCKEHGFSWLRNAAAGRPKNC